MELISINQSIGGDTYIAYKRGYRCDHVVSFRVLVYAGGHEKIKEHKKRTPIGVGVGNFLQNLIKAIVARNAVAVKREDVQ